MVVLPSIPTHPQDEGSFPLLDEKWGAIEEVLLLDAVEQDGFGNWSAMAVNPKCCIVI